MANKLLFFNGQVVQDPKNYSTLETLLLFYNKFKEYGKRREKEISLAITPMFLEAAKLVILNKFYSLIRVHRFI